MMSTQFKQRLLMSTLGIFFLSIIIYFSYAPFFKPIFVLTSAGIVSLALLEYYQLAQQKNLEPLISGGLSCSVAYMIATYLSLHHLSLINLSSWVLFFSFLAFFVPFFFKRSHPVINLAITLFGIAYLTIPLSFIIKINYYFIPENHQDGRLWLAYVLLITKMTDMGAYFSGKILGKTKLAPRISPKKTLEGAIGGLIAAILVSILFYVLVPTSALKMTAWQSIWLGTFLSLLAQFGDLAESILKRDAGIKDSSSLPGLGGILDVVDSLVFTLPFMYFILKLELIG